MREERRLPADPHVGEEAAEEETRAPVGLPDVVPRPLAEPPRLSAILEARVRDHVRLAEGERGRLSPALDLHRIDPHVATRRADQRSSVPRRQLARLVGAAASRELISHADSAMYAIKRTGKGAWRMWHGSVEQTL